VFCYPKLHYILLLRRRQQHIPMQGTSVGSRGEEGFQFLKSWGRLKPVFGPRSLSHLDALHAVLPGTV